MERYLLLLSSEETTEEPLSALVIGEGFASVESTISADATISATLPPLLLSLCCALAVRASTVAMATQENSFIAGRERLYSCKKQVETEIYKREEMKAIDARSDGKDREEKELVAQTAQACQQYTDANSTLRMHRSRRKHKLAGMALPACAHLRHHKHPCTERSLLFLVLRLLGIILSNLFYHATAWAFICSCPGPSFVFWAAWVFFRFLWPRTAGYCYCSIVSTAPLDDGVVPFAVGLEQAKEDLTMLCLICLVVVVQEWPTLAAAVLRLTNNSDTRFGA
ncbi:hypothetical protein BX070DRAFT_101505 [Coemansia spiralis]|nr:hypothetical protein BX070DRAFT_101505 [Coemansia spiralis]